MKPLIIQIIKQNKCFFIPVLIFYIFSIYRLISFSKINNHLFFNQYVGNPYVDWFFKYITYLGDGFFVIMIVILWSLKNIRQSLILLVSYVASGGLVAILKNYVFDYARPHFMFTYYYKEIHIKYVEGVEQLALNSFPSGHSTSAFVLFTFIALQLKKSWQKCTMAIVGILVTFSRVYLSQHWLVDIFAGSVLGLLLTILVYLVFEKYKILEKWNRGVKIKMS